MPKSPCYRPVVDVRTLDDQWLPVPDVADALGVADRDVRNMIRDQRLIGCRLKNVAGYRIPSAVLTGTPPTIIDGLRGSIIQLHDAGMTEEQIVVWLLTPHPELGSSPASALRDGQKHAVRRAALAEAL